MKFSLTQIGRKQFKLTVDTWGDFWDNLVSAVVENAAPTKIVLTFAQADTTLIASDFTVTGHTILTLTRDVTNTIFTLTLSTAILVFEDDLYVTLLTGVFLTYPITNNVADDGFTTMLLVYDDLANITKDAGQLISIHNAKVGIGGINQANGALQPLWDARGITFNGDCMAGAGVVLVPPFTQYFVLRQNTWGVNKRFCDGHYANSAILWQNDATPQIHAYAGVNSNGVSPDVYAWSIIRVLWNGVNSELQLNANAPVTGNFGSNGITTITLGAASDGTDGANFKYKVALYRDGNDAASVARTYNYLKRKYLDTCYNVVQEGHSFVDTPFVFPDSFDRRGYTVVGISGSAVSDLVTRQAATDALLIAGIGNYNNLTVWIGTNDLNSMTGAVVYAALKSYVQARVAAGWRVFVYTCTPSTYAGKGVQFEIDRNIYNGLMGTDLALLNHVYVLDTDTKTELSDSTDATYFSDLLHITAAGEVIATQLYVDRVNAGL